MVKFSKAGIIALISAVVLSGAAYAGVTWLPNYDGNLGSIVTDTKQPSCSDYKMLSDCPAPRKGNKTLVVQGLYCYKSCTCPTDYISSCPSGQVPSGQSCDGKYEYCACSTSEYTLNSRPTDKGWNCEACTDRNGTRYKCSCSATEFPLTSRPADENLSCKSCSDQNGTRYQCQCNSGYSCANGSKIKGNCTSCTKSVTCGNCHIYNSYTKQCVCDTAAGLVEQNGECVCNTTAGWLNNGSCGCTKKSCPTGYSTGVTSCDLSSTTPDMETNGYSGGEQCNKCVCNKPTCDRAYYDLESIPEGAANVVSCTEGCGSNEKTYYHADTTIEKVCRDGYSKCDKSAWCTGKYMTIETDGGDTECTRCVYDDYDLSVKECRAYMPDNGTWIDNAYNGSMCQMAEDDNSYNNCLDRLCATLTGIKHRKTYISSCEAPTCKSGYSFNPQEGCGGPGKGVQASDSADTNYCKKCGLPEEYPFSPGVNWYRWGGCEHSYFGQAFYGQDPAYPACADVVADKKVEPVSCDNVESLSFINTTPDSDEARRQAKTYAEAGCCYNVGDTKDFCRKLGYDSDTNACDSSKKFELCPCNDYYWRGCKTN